MKPASNTRKALTLALVVAAAGLLAACETDGSNSPGPFASLGNSSKPAEPAGPPEPPMTRTRAASECWMKTEKGSASVNVDKRADIVNKCIDDKMKGLEDKAKSKDSAEDKPKAKDTTAKDSKKPKEPKEPEESKEAPKT